MGYLLVVVVSLAVGGGVYAATVRSARAQPVAVGFDGGTVRDFDAGTPVGADADDVTDGAELRLLDAPHTTTTVDPPEPGTTYLRVSTRGPTWAERVQGLVGMVVLVIVGALVLAFGIYQLGHLVNVTIERFLGD